ncbi:MAG: K+-sensing histidine kinase KdpD [Cyclobacteriaceae bacterium]|jgi:K+-sensing histidine kinase KdpD
MIGGDSVQESALLEEIRNPSLNEEAMKSEIGSLQVHTYYEKENVTLEVSYNGQVISEEKGSKLFDSFF